MIFANSRYAGSQVIPVDRDGQVISVIVPGPAQAQTISYVSHLLTAQDRLDNLANQYYGDPSQWWVIAGANPELIDWSALATGTVIRVPFT